MTKLMTVIILAIAIWIAMQSAASARNHSGLCSDELALPPDKLPRPERLLAVREKVDRGAAAALAVRIYWVNVAHNSNCLVLQERQPDSDTPNRWTVITTIDTMRQPDTNQHLHLDVPSEGRACYRAYVANTKGRSKYSNQVCLQLGANYALSPTEIPSGDTSVADTLAPPPDMNRYSGPERNSVTGKNSPSPFWIALGVIGGLALVAGVSVIHFLNRS